MADLSVEFGAQPKPKKRKMTKGVKDAKQYESKKDDFYDDL